MVDEINANFYRAFEDRYRGSRELIKSRLRVYMPFVKPLCNFYDEAKAVDLGCGRGEWLELLQESGFDVQGVDLDNGMLAACRERDLNVQTGDAVSFLKKLPSASQVIVTGFHIAEHITFSDLQILVEEALRVLKPGGLLILETPNPENIVVGTSYFFIDPTHIRPIPPQLLSFLPEHYGFKKVKILRLQEPTELHGDNEINLLDVLRGVSPDCAVVAQKTGEAAILAATNSAFEAEYGLTLENLASRYYQQAKSKTSPEEVNAVSNQLWLLVEARNQQIHEILQSHSWRITAPLRWTSAALRRFIPETIKTHIKNFLRRAAVCSTSGSESPNVQSGVKLIIVDDKYPQSTISGEPVISPNSNEYYNRRNEASDQIKVSDDQSLISYSESQIENQETNPKDLKVKTYVKLSYTSIKADKTVMEKKLRDIIEETKKKSDL